MTTLAAVAARTTRLKFGPSVIVLPYRTPVVAAKEMATIDWLSRGRLFPAVGVGVELPREFEASGVPFRERGRRTDEAIRVIRLLWTQDEVTFQGEFFKLDRIRVLPQPVADPAAHLDRRQERGGRAPHRPARRRLDPVVHHAGRVPRGGRAGARARRGEGRRGARRSLRHPHQLRHRRHARAGRGRWPRRTFRAAAWTRPPCGSARPSARPRSSSTRSRSTSRRAARSSSCVRSAPPT